jgi:hypothetical protein|tara:strand:+ start:84 stop:476 length:393 start_codon:yes stop_codon:yes gene_type:complete
MVVFIGIKILFDAVYEVYGDVQSTNWTIAYNSINYLVMASVLMFISQNENKIMLIQTHNNFISWLFNMLGMLYTAYAMIEITFINSELYDYRLAMSEGYFKLNYAGVLIFSVVIYTAIYKLKIKYNHKWI